MEHPRERSVMRPRIVVALVVAALVVPPWIFGGAREQLGEQARRRLPCAFAKLKEGYTCYELQGEAPAEAVVFVHGFSSPSYVWGQLPATLRESGYLTLVYDLYGRGSTARPWVKYDLDLFDRQLESLLRTVGLGPRVHLVGLSMGGIIASEFALRHPAMVASLTLIDPAGFGSELPVGTSILTTPLVGDWLMEVLGGRMLIAANSKSVHDKSRVGDLVRRFEPQLEFAGFRRAILSTLRSMPLEDFTERYAELGRTGLPIEVFWGTRDEITPVAGAKLAATLLPQAAIHEVEDAGHLAHYEKTEEVGLEMIRFFEASPAPDQEGLRRPGIDVDLEQGAPPPACRECEAEPKPARPGAYSRPRFGESRNAQ
ncbi:MAG: alpha/beta fold hydrolase [Candidatus Binatia bacterium]